MDGSARGRRSDTVILRPYRLIHFLLDEAAAVAPQASAVRDSAGAWSYVTLNRFSHAFAGWLRARGVGRGDRVIVQLPTNRELVAAFYGASRRGAVFVPLNPAMKSFHLREVIANAEPSLIIAADGAAESLRGIAAVPVHGFGQVWAEVTALAAQGAPAGPAEVHPADVAVLIYTSGSTAAPKAVIGTHASMTFATAAIDAVLAYRRDDVVLCRFPMSWDYGLYKVLLCGVARCELVLAGDEFDLRLLRRMRETGTTVVPIVPSLATMIARLAERDAGPPPPVRMFTNTGAALPQPTIDALRKAFPGVRVVRQFGQTECKRISIMPPEQDRERPSSVGLPLPGTQVEVVDADGLPVPAGQIGEIVVTGPHVMPGYWRMPELTARTLRPDPRTGAVRLHTGDYGRRDEDGYLYFEGRRDDMFKRKGIRLSTLEIEAAALDVPGVRAAAVLPPTARRDLALFVEADLAPHTVLRELARRLEPAKVPATCHVVAEFPLTLHGKHACEQLAQLLDRDDP